MVKFAIITTTMSIAMEILESLLNTSLNYKGLRVNVFGIPTTLINTLYRLNKENYVYKKDDLWVITPKGKRYLKENRHLASFKSPFKSKSAKDLIVIFDIPETKRVERRWFRNHLIKFGYLMIQKSVWVGPSPLPTDFLKYTKEIGLKNSIKTFKLSKPYKQLKSK